MIETLKVQNYKSLKNIEIPLKPLTVLVGPNAAGKSNILDCLGFLAEIARSPDAQESANAFRKRGAYGDIVWGGRSQEPISVSCKWRALHADEESFDYLLVIKAGEQHRPLNIIEEQLSTRAPGVGNGSFHRQDGTVRFGSSVKDISPQQSVLHDRREPMVRSVKEVITSWAFYDFVTQSMRQPQPVAKQTRLQPDGSNVATLLHWIFSEERKLFSQVEEHLKAAIPEVDELMSPLTEDGKTYVAWREKDIPGRIPAWNMSEGSVRLVAMLLGLIVPQPPSLVTFENPDLHLHAHLMQYLAEILKAGSRHSQIIITTHSPYLLDHIPPESVLIVWKEAGETKVKPVADTAELKEALKTLGLGELYYTGSLGGVP